MKEDLFSKNNETVKLDLTGVPCPINYVKTQLKLEDLEKGETLEVILDDGEPIQMVPRSVRDDGHRILSVKRIDENHFRLLVVKE